MAEWLASIMPNVVDYSDKFWTSCIDTAQMFLISGGFMLVIGGFFGVLLTVTQPGGIAENRVLYRVVDTVINIFRSIPFVILIALLMNLTKVIMGTRIGVKGVIVPLVFGSTPFFARQVDAALAGVDKGLVEAAQSMGIGPVGIIFRVYLKEGTAAIARGTTITLIKQNRWDNVVATDELGVINRIHGDNLPVTIALIIQDLEPVPFLESEEVNRPSVNLRQGHDQAGRGSGSCHVIPKGRRYCDIRVPAESLDRTGEVPDRKRV